MAADLSATLKMSLADNFAFKRDMTHRKKTK
jgi:hypothetical protein